MNSVQSRIEIANRIGDVLSTITRRDAELIRDQVLSDIPLLMAAIDAGQDVSDRRDLDPEAIVYERWITKWREVSDE